MTKKTGLLVLLAALLLFGIVAVTIHVNVVDSKPVLSEQVEVDAECTENPEAELSEKVAEDRNATEQGSMFEFNLVAHALGGIDGYTYLNSKEGFEDSYRRGMWFIETDLFFSADGKLICSHGFKEADAERMGIEGVTVGNPPEYETWNSMRFHGKYTTQDAEDILYYLEAYPELYFEFDMRSLKGEDAYRMANALLEVFGRDEALYRRILIQVYSPEMYEIFKEVYDFPVMQFYMTKAFVKEIDTYIEYCQNHEIVSIAISDAYVTEENFEKLLNSGLKIMVHTVDDPIKAQSYLDRGVAVICTNHLYYDVDGTLKSKLLEGENKE